MTELYLDNAATTPIDAAVRAAMAPFLDDAFGNPSSRHPAGSRATDAIEAARTSVARALGTRPDTVVFTSGGTEANNLAVLGLARAAAAKGRHIVLGATEHPSVRDAAEALVHEGFEVETAALDGDGRTDLDDWARRLRSDTVVVAQMLANNEFGTIYPVAELSAIVRARAPHARFHTDAVQGFGKLDVRLPELGVDTISISAHKFHGPKGVGALVVGKGTPLRPLVFGGGQERGVRSGTENVAGIVGLGAAAEQADRLRAETWERLRTTRAAFLDAVASIEGVTPLAPGGADHVLPNVISLRVPGAPAEVYLHHLEAAGVFVSAGSACQEKKKSVSPALLSLGLTADQARSVLRFSTSRETTVSDVRAAAQALAGVVRELGVESR